MQEVMTTSAPPTEPTVDDLDVPSVTARHFGLAVLALAMGGFAIGTTEFVTMGLLPQIADGVDVSIPTGGHVISAYAVGVVVGAPVLAFLGARLPRRALLVALMAAFAVGNAVSALATSYEQLMLARFAAAARIRAKAARYHADEAAVHRPAHDVAKDRARAADERAGDDHRGIVEREAHRGGRPARIAVEH